MKKKTIRGIMTLLTVVVLVGAFALSFTACGGDGSPGGGGGNYNVGDTGPGGGKIFYHKPSGFTVQGYGNPGDPGYFASYTAYYLEAAPVTSTASWGDSGTFVVGITTAGNENRDEIIDIIGNGRKDTQVIVAHMNGKAIEDTAAQICNAYSNNGKSDWFLPSLGELRLYYRSTVVEQKGSDVYYWSSSQEPDYAWTINFLSGTAYRYWKSNNINVRAIRAF